MSKSSIVAGKLAQAPTRTLKGVSMELYCFLPLVLFIAALVAVFAGTNSELVDGGAAFLCCLAGINAGFWGLALLDNAIWQTVLLVVGSSLCALGALILLAIVALALMDWALSVIKNLRKQVA